ncbi:DUF262 domain-containing protein [Prevotella histicola]|uniref:DUF262 domain-containing protein n=1 Tax=Prevotella histicola TaxID=470565 RepID=UPI0028DB5A16|nr:DUF262 domain-containing protein [Prevotella histicola]
MKYATHISEFFYDPKAFFIIPLYQRKYAWDRDNCRRLFEDILKIQKYNRPSHFFGSIVTVKDNELENDLLVIDGQQRITTISLIILALRNAVNKGQLECEDKEMMMQTTQPYLYAMFRKVPRKIKLCPIESDKPAYDVLFENNPKKFITSSGLTDNYNFYYEQIISCGLTFEQIFEAVEKLIIIDLRLESSDEPQLIFESLNSTGKDLTEADKVRNFLLMALTKDQQEDYYHRYWKKIEEYTDGDPTMFIRDYLTIHIKRICNINNLYFEFKEFSELNNKDREEFLADLLHYAEYYTQIVKGRTESIKINRKLNQLASIGSQVAMPFYLSFFNYKDQHLLSEEAVYEVLDITENYWARRIICGYPANVMQKLYATLHHDVMRIYERHEKRNIPVEVSYAEIMKYLLLKKQGNSIFPDDRAVDMEFPTRQIYKLPIDYKYFLFERMENENSNEGIQPIVEKMKEGVVTIEHIMPQTLTLQWKQELGERYEEIYEKYLHTFANLTLTGYNTNYSNRSFQDKKNGYEYKGVKVYGLNESKYELSSYLKTCDYWTEEQLIERGTLLLQRFKSLWPMISTIYTPLEKDMETVSLADDEYEWTSRNILAFTYKGQKYTVSNWKSMLIQLCQLLYKENPTSIIHLSHNGLWLHDTEKNNRTKVAEGCFVHTACDTRTKKTIIKFIFEKCHIPETDLEIHLQPVTEKQLEEE